MGRDGQVESLGYRILALDGGGMRGLVSVLLLERLRQQVPGLLARADMLAGTSSGALIALGLAAGQPLERMAELFEAESPVIFADSPLDDLADLGRLVGAEYDTQGLEGALRRLLGDLPLAGLAKHVLVPAFDLDTGDDPDYGGESSPRRRWKAKIFRNFPGPDSDGDTLAWRVGLRSAAAPVYFPSFDGFIDGGVVAANPAMCALAQTQDRRAFDPPPELATISLLSVGTGSVTQFLPGSRHDWGVAQWGRPLVDIVLGGSVEVAVYQCRSMLGERFTRVSPPLVRNDRLRLDSRDPASLARMRRIAFEYPIADTVAWLQRFW